MARPQLVHVPKDQPRVVTYIGVVAITYTVAGVEERRIEKRVEIEINVDRLLVELGAKAIKNKTRVAREIGGVVVASSK